MFPWQLPSQHLPRQNSKRVGVTLLKGGYFHLQEGSQVGNVQVVREENLMEAGGLLPASVRALSGGDAEDAPEEFIPQSRAQQLRLGVRQAHHKTRAL